MTMIVLPHTNVALRLGHTVLLVVVASILLLVWTLISPLLWSFILLSDGYRSHRPPISSSTMPEGD